MASKSKKPQPDLNQESHWKQIGNIALLLGTLTAIYTFYEKGKTDGRGKAEAECVAQKNIIVTQYQTEKELQNRELDSVRSVCERLKTRRRADSLNLINLAMRNDNSDILLNVMKNDLPTVMITNATINPVESGYAKDSSVNKWGLEATAVEGDIISVHVYYHNGGSQLAKDVYITMRDKFFPASRTHTIYGAVGSDGRWQNIGSATVYLDKPLTLTFVSGSVHWSPNQGHQTINLSPDNENIVFTNSGFKVGNVPPGWYSQGVLTFNYVVGRSKL